MISGATAICTGSLESELAVLDRILRREEEGEEVDLVDGGSGSASSGSALERSVGGDEDKARESVWQWILWKLCNPMPVVFQSLPLILELDLHHRL